jgi:CBS domain-containing protein
MTSREKAVEKLSARTKDLMEVPPIVVSEETTVDEAASLMWEKNIGSVIVVDSAGKIAGILTERDMLFAVTKSLTGRKVPVSSIMSRTKLLARPNQNLFTAFEIMRKAGVRHLPVVDSSGTPIGMVSIRDTLDMVSPLLKLVLEPPKAPKKTPRD